VPEDVLIVGFDNIELAANVEPALTTVDVPAAETGERAADYLSARVAGQSVLSSVHLESTLIARRTTGPAPRTQ
jgi:LacI family transcriptional regulator